MTEDEFGAVKEILLDRLHTTEDDELQAALYQMFTAYDDMELRLTRLRTAVRLMVGEARK